MCTGYVDKSKRKPYRCGVCGRDIRDPTHQLYIPGTAPVRAPEPFYARWTPPEPTEPDRYGHQPDDPMYGIDDRQGVMFVGFRAR